MKTTETKYRVWLEYALKGSRSNVIFTHEFMDELQGSYNEIKEKYTEMLANLFTNFQKKSDYDHYSQGEISDHSMYTLSYEWGDKEYIRVRMTQM